MFSGYSGCFQAILNVSRLFWMFPDYSKCFQTILHDSRLLWMLPDSGGFWMLPNSSGFIQTVPDTSILFCMFMSYLNISSLLWILGLFWLLLVRLFWMYLDYS
jgi:hypothetical protein